MSTPLHGLDAVPLERLALFLDLDGTLAPIRPRPDDVKVQRRRRDVLASASASLEGRVAVLSGRTIGEVDRILAGGIPCVAGVHGLQRRTSDGEVQEWRPHPRLREATNTMRAFARAEPELLLEIKPQSTALHYRARPSCEPALIELAERLAQSTGLVAQMGDRVIELLTPGTDKGAALRAFMAEPPFTDSIPVFFGDDLTDEHAFAAARALGGAGISVGSPRRDTAALASVPDPDGVYGRIEQALRIGVFNIGDREWGG